MTVRELIEALLDEAVTLDDRVFIVEVFGTDTVYNEVEAVHAENLAFGTDQGLRQVCGVVLES